jgi:hypothetical protein
MVDNPEIKKLKKEKAGKATELHKLKLQLADWVLKQNDKAAFEDLKKTKIKLLADIAKADNDILLLNQQIDKTLKKYASIKSIMGENYSNSIMKRNDFWTV